MSMSERMENKRIELFASLVASAARLLQEYGMQERAASLVAGALADEVADLWGGQVINMPKDYQRLLSKRDIEIYERYNGRNHAELALEYGLTERGMYKAISRIRERLRKQAAGMPDLFTPS